MSDSLFHAVKTNDIPRVYTLVREGVDVNSTNENGMTPLHVATKNNNTEMMDILKEAGTH